MRARGREDFRKGSPINWTDQHVLDVKQTLDACKLFIYFIFYNLADSGLGSVETSLAGAMNLNGVPNDLFSNFNPLAIIVVIPVLDYIVYPLLRRFRINFRPIQRVFRICYCCYVASCWSCFATPCLPNIAMRQLFYELSRTITNQCLASIFSVYLVGCI